MTDLGAAAPVMGERVPQGIVFEDIEEHDLWGAVALNELHSKRAKKKGKKSEKPEKDKSEAKVQKSHVKDSAYTPPSRSTASDDSEKADAKQQFLAAYQKCLSEGLSQTEAAAKALKTIQGA
eukprot:symbB.v1.2.038263.t1/scaffold5898.1/size44610/4